MARCCVLLPIALALCLGSAAAMSCQRVTNFNTFNFQKDIKGRGPKLACGDMFKGSIQSLDDVGKKCWANAKCNAFTIYAVKNKVQYCLYEKKALEDTPKNWDLERWPCSGTYFLTKKRTAPELPTVKCGDFAVPLIDQDMEWFPRLYFPASAARIKCTDWDPKKQTREVLAKICIEEPDCKSITIYQDVKQGFRYCLGKHSVHEAGMLVDAPKNWEKGSNGIACQGTYLANIW